MEVICQTISLRCLDPAVNRQTTPHINFHYIFATAATGEAPWQRPACPFLSSPNINEGAHKGMLC